jgi:2-polyprenyl-6-methoxyphenol hydroxylase-like FAD-dependent oxidoreductase
MKLRIAIVGYGTAGQASAALLARDGHAVEVFEQAPVLGPVGAGFLLQPVGLSVLWRLGLFDEVLRHGLKVRRLYGETPRGRGVMDMRYTELDTRLFGLGLQRGALFALLAQAWPDYAAAVRAGRRIVALDAERGVLRDAQGDEHGAYDVVVVADGSASKLRAAAGHAKLDQPYPWGALWCLIPAGEWPHLDELRQRYCSARKMIGLLPVGTRPGDDIPRLSFFWSLPVSDFARWENAGLAPWKREVEALWPQAAALLEAIVENAQLARATYRDAVLPRWHRGRAVLAGDSAHAMSPQLGQGVNMALLDAQALSDALRECGSVPEALHLYECERRDHTAIYQFWSRWLTPLFQSERDSLAAVRDACFRPLGRLPGGRGTMLRVLSGTQRGWLGKFGLPREFLRRLDEA